MQSLMFGRMFRISCIVFFMVALLGCGDTTIKQFECNDDTECKASQSCQDGSCVVNDQDGDGWAPSKGGDFSRSKDCNDNNKDVHPGAPEICDNKTDDNCDGRTDEQPCQCQNGKTRECGTDLGICKKGTQTCKAGVWGACEGSVEPKVEECNGIDDDCDGTIDEEVANCCQPNQTRPCGSDKGECELGIQKCDTGKWTVCEGSKGPENEECNSKDDDCDGKVDNIKDSSDPLQQTCYSGDANTRKKGTCQDGFQLCKEGKWDTCQQEVLPEEEVCDNKDNDCDGQIDNVKGENKILQRECYSGDAGTKGKGVCKAGIERCTGGQWSTCVGEALPGKETCNGIDDDCDGQVDNTPGETKPLSQVCYSGSADTRQKGICKDGTQECTNGRWDSCKNDTLPGIEDCNGKDDDCDGRVDNVKGQPTPLSGACYSGSPSTRGKGACKDGSQTCTNGSWSACLGEVLPAAKEDCNGKDDDCNGAIDDQLPDLGTCQSNLQGECKAGTFQCVSGSKACVSITKPKTEVCNGKDDDCNGAVDDGNPGGGTACNFTGKPGICSAGKLECRNGNVQCIQVVSPATEVCNGKDDNCDGTTDNGASCSRGFSCNAGSCSACSQPTSRCSNYDLFCTSTAPAINCNCGFTSYCFQQSASIFCSGCCAERRCR